MKKSELKQIIKEEIHKAFSEIKVVKPDVFFPVVTEFEDSSYSINIDNLIKNIRKFERVISTFIGIKDEEKLHNFLTHYANMIYLYSDSMKRKMYKDMTLDKWLKELKSLYDFIKNSHWESNHINDHYTKEDIFG